MNGEKTTYYTTFCTRDFEPSLWREGADSDIAPEDDIPLSVRGFVVERAINAISENFTLVRPDKYVIMPNHVHMLLSLQRVEGQSDSATAKLVSTVVSSVKRASTKEDKSIVWQKSSNDRPIRCDEGYRIVSEYIDANPSKWSADCYKMS